jgi:hypothetical protein
MKDEIEATCPACSRTKKIRREWLGRKIQCPCGNEFLLEYPAVKKVEVEESPTVDPRNGPEAPKKSAVPTVQAFEIRKSLLGGFKAWLGKN